MNEIKSGSVTVVPIRSLLLGCVRKLCFVIPAVLLAVWALFSVLPLAFDLWINLAYVVTLGSHPVALCGFAAFSSFVLSALVCAMWKADGYSVKAKVSRRDWYLELGLYAMGLVTTLVYLTSFNAFTDDMDSFTALNVIMGLAMLLDLVLSLMVLIGLQDQRRALTN